jgi:hypothetical protein
VHVGFAENILKTSVPVGHSMLRKGILAIRSAPTLSVKLQTEHFVSLSFCLSGTSTRQTRYSTEEKKRAKVNKKKNVGSTAIHFTDGLPMVNFPITKHSMSCCDFKMVSVEYAGEILW